MDADDRWCVGEEHLEHSLWARIITLSNESLPFVERADTQRRLLFFRPLTLLHICRQQLTTV